MNTAPVIQSGIFDLIMHSGPVGKLVLMILLFISVICWAIIFTKWRVFKKAVAENTRFLQFFWQSKSIDEIYAQIDGYQYSPVAAVFRAGVKELKKLPNSDTLEDLRTDNVSRALMRASTYELSMIEKNIGLLASVASAAPFIGLFGTVWGIMTAFQSIGASGSASLAVVAPGIGAAIPASIFYNYFVGQIKRMAVDVDGFSQDFINIIERSAMGAKRGT
jgi:biopolymer transport protein TolQ